MRRLYDRLVNSKYELLHYYGLKLFSFEEKNGTWSKQFTVSKYGKKYVIYGFEGTQNIIKTFKAEIETLKEVYIYLGI